MGFANEVHFKQEWVGYIGPELEFFLVDPRTGLPTPKAVEFLRIMTRLAPGEWTFELSRCQVEFRPIKPYANISEMRAGLYKAKKQGEAVAVYLGLLLVPMEAAPEDMPYDIYPDPKYLAMAASMPEWKIRAACRVAGTHFHYGCRDLAHQVQVSNRLKRRLPRFRKMGDSSNGKRLQLYERMAPQEVPPIIFRDENHFLEHADDQGYEFVRNTVLGTTELRVLGTPKHIETVLDWAEFVWEVARFDSQALVA